MSKPRTYSSEPLRNPDVGVRVKKLMEEKGWSQADLMRAAGISRSEVSRISAGVRSPSCSIMQQIAAALGVSVDYLIAGGSKQAAENVAPDIVDFLQKYWGRLDNSDKTLLRVTIGHLQQKVQDQDKRDLVAK